jgi:hypothetical protein
LRYYTSICLEALRINAEVIIRAVNIRTEILTGEPPNTDRSVNDLARCSVAWKYPDEYAVSINGEEFQNQLTNSSRLIGVSNSSSEPISHGN